MKPDLRLQAGPADRSLEPTGRSPTPAGHWLEWAQQVQAIAQTGLNYSQNEFDIERYRALHRIAAEMMAEYSDTAPEQVESLFLIDTGHATPKIDVRGAVFRGDDLLLVRERASGKWTLPGGFADVGESAAEAVAREVREESGYAVRPTRLLALYDRARHDHIPVWFYCYKAFFECELQPETGWSESETGWPVGSDSFGSLETTDAGFFRRDALPEIDTGRVTLHQLERMWELHSRPDAAADFD
jgi:ADP-ribose pyrophosphatase YjhB (NUDIX family)